MNIMFFITPKHETVYLYRDASLADAIETMDRNHFTAVPILDREGKYAGTLTEGDILYYIHRRRHQDLDAIMKESVGKLKRRWKILPVKADARMEDLITLSMSQNYVPVVDDNEIFIGIVTRKAIIEYCYNHSTVKSAEANP